MRYLIFLTALLYAVASSANQAAIRFQKLSIEDGLSQNSVYTISQDNIGFLWFGTSDGLNRYDGYHFKHFKHNPKDKNSISSNYIMRVLQDSNGTLWVGTREAGLNRYDARLQTFERLMFDEADPLSLSSNAINTLVEDAQGNLWVGTAANGLNRYDPKQGGFIRYRHQPGEPNSLSNDKIQTLYVDNNGTLWIGTEGGGLNRFIPASGQFERIGHNNWGNRQLDVQAIYQDSNDRLWVGTADGLSWLDIKTQRLVKVESDNPDLHNLTQGSISTIIEDKQNTLWVGSDGGIFQLDKDRQQFIAHQHQPADKHSISSNTILSMFEDTKGLLWFGTYSGGLNKVDVRQRQFGHFKRNTTNPHSLSHNTVMPILVDSRDTLWVGTDGGGLNKQAKNSAGFEHFKAQPGTPNSLSHNRVWTLIEDSDGFIWIGTLGGGLDRLDPVSGQFKHFGHDPNNPASLSKDAVISLFEDSRNNLWAGTWDAGLNRLDRQTGKIERFKHQPSDPHSLSDDIVTSFFEDSSGRFWVGTFNSGLNLLDRDSKKFSHYRHDSNNPASISNNGVMCIFQDSRGTLWIATYGGGLNRFDPDNQQFSHYRIEHGLPSDSVYGIVEDKQGFLWLSTNNGLSKFDSQNQTFTNFDQSDGLQSDEFNADAYFSSDSGELFFGGINGYNRFYPEQISKDTQPPKLSLTNFLVFNQTVPIESKPSKALNNDPMQFHLTQAIEHNRSITLEHQHTLVSFEFAALDFASPMRSQYAYRLQGFDKNWIYTDAENRRATYTSLPSGNYTLRVRASNPNGFWHQQGVSIGLTVNPPWWQSTQAYLFYLLTGLSAIYLFYRFRTRALMKRADELEHNVEQRTATINQLLSQRQKMFTNVSHEFKTPLTLILTPLQTLSTQSTGFEQTVSMMKRNGQRLLHMVEQLLELSEIETNLAVQRHYYSLAEALHRLLSSFQPLLDGKNLTLKQNSFADVVLHLTTDSLEMILNNLISNAIKYTPINGEINIKVMPGPNNVVISISDNGIGISPENQEMVFNRFTRVFETHDESIPGAGIGLALVKELVEANQGSISLNSEVDHGSTFTVILPFSSERDGEVEAVSGMSTATLIEMDTPQPDKAKVRAVENDNQTDTRDTLLLVDDNADMLTLLTDTLGQAYQCLTCNSGESAIETAKTQLPDLVVSDLMMPGISGFEVLKQLKEDSLTCHIPVVLLTAKGDIESRLRGWSQRADEYLEKPFNAEELLGRIDNILTIRQLLSNRYQQNFSEPGKSLKNNQPEPLDNDGIDKANQAFFDQIETVLAEHYQDESFDVPMMASVMALSQRQLSRKMKSMFDMTPVESLRNFRLKKAAELLRQGVRASVVSHQVGFAAHSYFSKCFKARFNCMPSEY